MKGQNTDCFWKKVLDRHEPATFGHRHLDILPDIRRHRPGTSKRFLAMGQLGHMSNCNTWHQKRTAFAVHEYFDGIAQDVQIHAYHVRCGAMSLMSLISKCQKPSKALPEGGEGDVCMKVRAMRVVNSGQ